MILQIPVTVRLTLAFLFLIVQGSYGQTTSNSLKTISPTEFKSLLAPAKKVLLLDVRTPEEFAKSHITGAINIDFYDPDFKNKLLQLNQHDKILIYCKSGRRSALAGQILTEHRKSEVYNLDGGITKWTEQNLPVELPTEK